MNDTNEVNRHDALMALTNIVTSAGMMQWGLLIFEPISEADLNILVMNANRLRAIYDADKREERP